jgi:putative nucleotidyltransferase with HDIG domain
VVKGALILAGRPAKPFGPGDTSVLGILARQSAVGIDNAIAHERAINFFTHISDILVLCLERQDHFSPGHSRRVAALADMLTRRMGMSDVERRHTHFAALLHDIGKIMLDPSALKEEAYETEQGLLVMQQHPALGVELLRPVTVWEDVLPVIHAHHERWDGAGYPAGLAGEDIPLGARIVAVAEAFDTMTREVSYGVRRTPEAALAELEACAGTQFDPRLVRLFVAEYATTAGWQKSARERWLSEPAV